MTTILMAGGGTGGHLFPAIAVAEAVLSLRPEWQAHFVGATRGIEARVLPERELGHTLLPFEPIHRRQWWLNVRWPFRAPGLIRQVDRLLDRLAPAVVIGSGGYVSGPVVWRAARRGIPTGILELDARPGLATRLAARHADGIWLAAAEAATGLPVAVRQRITVTGAPIVPPDRSRQAAAAARFGIDRARPVVVVTGGSQGALALNRAVSEWIALGGASDCQVIWATGRGSYHEFVSHHAPPAVNVIDFINPMADAWALATIAIARAGMMTLAELAAWGIPAILVPLPTAAADHQSHNARAAAADGAALVLPQSSLTAASLTSEVGRMLGDRTLLAAMAGAALGRGRPDASRAIAERAIALGESTGKA